MTVSNVTIIRDVGGREVVEERPISTSTFYVKIDGERYSPAITTELEIENGDGTAALTDQCGNTERRKLNDMGWSIRVSGILTMNDAREGNLSLQMVRDTVAQMDSITIGSDIISGEIVVTNIIITQTGDLVSINTRSTDGDEKAVEFQMQLGETESEGGF